MPDFDAIIIGTGQAGPSLAFRLAGAPEVAGSHLLLAVGRRPNTDALDLDKAGVRCDERGYIVVDDRL